MAVEIFATRMMERRRYGKMEERLDPVHGLLGASESVKKMEWSDGLEKLIGESE